MLPTFAKPAATATIEPIGRRSTVPRDHLVKLTLQLSPIDARHADKGIAVEVAKGALAGFPLRDGEAGRRDNFGDVSVATRPGRGGGPTSVVVGIEGSMLVHGRPDDEPVAQLRAALSGGGYRVAVRELRECSEPTCSTVVVADWNSRQAVPAGWHSQTVCGRHSYRTCAACKSTFVMSSVNAAGQAPSLSCVVCGSILVEWGSSKVWSAELVRRGDPPAAHAAK